MKNEGLFLFMCCITFVLPFIIWIYISKSRLKVIIINFTMILLYVGSFFYDAVYNDHSGGTGLVWIYYLMFTVCLHWLVSIIFVVILAQKRNRENYSLPATKK